ncbi:MULTISPECIES: shikimate kinase [unclassified Enterococcus]|uniref:shikimate kinase n=1 Tax=unclassified Enterococcus TaxID=2608891 RepID=UPI0013ED2501|nr:MULTISPECIES: shikimate kinase [unclassified Enterococcus]
MSEIKIDQSIVLIGFMGTGKTTVGNLLAKKTGMQAIDLDHHFEEQYQTTVGNYFNDYGEECFREKETELLAQVLTDPSPKIIATGGGIITRKENRRILAEEKQVVFLETAMEETYRRLLADQKTVRPLATEQTIDSLASLYQRRYPLYQEVASYRLVTDGKTPEKITEEIIRLLTSPLIGK